MSQPLVLTSEQDSSKIGVQALVVGGSIAGLLAARVLLDYFDRVILLERDEYPEHPKARAGVPQGTHVHGLLLQGQQILEELFFNQNYSEHKLYRPLLNQSDFMNVSLGVSILRLIEFDETQHVRKPIVYYGKYSNI